MHILTGNAYSLYRVGSSCLTSFVQKTFATFLSNIQSMLKINKGGVRAATLEIFRHNECSYYIRSVASDNYYGSSPHWKDNHQLYRTKTMEQYT